MIKEFEIWRKQNEDQFPVPLIVEHRNKSVFYQFFGVPHLSLRVAKSGAFEIWAHYGDDSIDIVTDFDVAVKRNPVGLFYCELCAEKHRFYAKNRLELFSRHTFEPFLRWCRANLRADRQLLMYRDGGFSWAKIVSPAEVKKTVKKSRRLLWNQPVIQKEAHFLLYERLAHSIRDPMTRLEVLESVAEAYASQGCRPEVIRIVRENWKSACRIPKRARNGNWARKWVYEQAVKYKIPLPGAKKRIGQDAKIRKAPLQSRRRESERVYVDFQLRKFLGPREFIRLLERVQKQARRKRIPTDLRIEWNDIKSLMRELERDDPQAWRLLPLLRYWEDEYHSLLDDCASEAAKKKRWTRVIRYLRLMQSRDQQLWSLAGALMETDPVRSGRGFPELLRFIEKDLRVQVMEHDDG